MNKPRPLRAAAICMCMTAIVLQIPLADSVSLDSQRLAGSMGSLDYSSASAGCIKLRYQPSQWEEFWINSMDKFVVSDRKWRERCALMNSSRIKIQEWLNLSRSWQAAEQLSQVASIIESRICSESTCSHHIVVDVCAGTEIGHIPIEPLVGDTRFPNSSCTGSFGQCISKDHLLPLPGPIHLTSHGRKTGSRNFFFDLGASTYTSGAGGASQSWFIRQYQKLGVHFDRVFAWEAMHLSPEAIFGRRSRLPDAVFDTLSYYNIPISAEVNAKYNPLRTLKAVATKDDLVVIKIDFDSPELEEALMAQILADRDLYSLIDELFYEHHVHGTPLGRLWGKGNLRCTNSTLVDTYALFTHLRQLGIRAHSWV